MGDTFSINSKSVSREMTSLQHFQDVIQKKIDQFCSDNGQENILQPVNYILGLGGKRVRPLLTLLAADLFTDDIEDAIYPALAIEVFHNFTLMHDDIMDNAPLRRGNATVHEKWNRDVAILSGDAMLIQAYQLMIRTRPDCIEQVMQTFNTTALEVCQGQQLDMDFQERNNVTIEEYIAMIRLKTSVLLGGAMKIGAFVAGASKEDQQCLYDFAISLGLSFQLWDDYLDTFGDGNKTGKQVGGDILANKKTFLMIRAMELANEEQLELFKKDFTTTKKVEIVTQLFKDLQLEEALKTLVDDYYTKALQSLQNIRIAPERKQKIVMLAESLHRREF